MKKSISFNGFTDAFRDMGREDQFTYKGKRALYDYLEEYEESTGEEVELDVIALCCEFTEYDTALECAKEYPRFTIDEDHDEDEQEEDAKEFLRDNTTLIEVEGGGVIIADF